MATRILILLCLFASSAQAAVTVSFTASRTTGVAPLAVYFDATATTSTVSVKPFHHIHYAWDFDDSSAGNWRSYDASTQTWPIGSRDKNVAIGPVAAHIFETAGSYTVTLTAKDAEGVVVSTTETITVTDADTQYAGSDTVCFSNSGDYIGCPVGASDIQTDSFDEVMATYHISNRRLLLAAGDVFTTDETVALNIDGITLGRYGTGAAPRIVSSIDSAFEITADDLRIIGIEFEGTASTDSKLFTAPSRVINALFLRVSVARDTWQNIYDFPYTPLDTAAEDIHQGLFIVENTLFDTGQCLLDESQAGYGIRAAAAQLVLLGNRIEDVINGHDLAVLEHVEGAVIGYNVMADQSADKALVSIRSRDEVEVCSAGCGRKSQQVVISNNQFYSAAYRGVTLVRQNAIDEVPRAENIIIERNYFAGSLNVPSVAKEAVSLTDNTEHVSVRANVLNMSGWAEYRGLVNVGADEVEYYNNTCYMPDTINALVNCVRLSRGAALTAKNNLLYGPHNIGNEVVRNLAAATVEANHQPGNLPFAIAAPAQAEHFELADDSVMLDAGADVPVFIDHLGRSVPINTIDVGALEHQTGLPEPEPEDWVPSVCRAPGA